MQAHPVRGAKLRAMLERIDWESASCSPEAVA